MWPPERGGGCYVGSRTLGWERERRWLLALPAAVVVAVLLLTFVWTQRAAAGPGEPDLTFRGPLATGGTVSVTLTADRSALLRAALLDVNLPPCLESLPIARYWDPPVPLSPPSETSLGGFRVGIDFGPTVHSSRSVTLRGNVLSETTIEGTAEYFSLPCTTDPISWSSQGPVATPPDEGDLVFEGSVDGGGSIVLTTDASRSSVTSAVLSGVSVPPCTHDNPLDLRAFFEPPVPVEGSAFTADVTREPFEFTEFFVGGAFADEFSLVGAISAQATLDPVLGCSGEVAWSARQAGGPAPTATSPPETDEPAATPSLAVGALPSAGAGGGADDGGPPVAWAATLAAAAALALLGAAALARKSR